MAQSVRQIVLSRYIAKPDCCREGHPGGPGPVLDVKGGDADGGEDHAGRGLDGTGQVILGREDIDFRDGLPPVEGDLDPVGPSGVVVGGCGGGIEQGGAVVEVDFADGPVRVGSRSSVRDSAILKLPLMMLSIKYVSCPNVSIGHP